MFTKQRVREVRFINAPINGTHHARSMKQARTHENNRVNFGTGKQVVTGSALW